MARNLYETLGVQRGAPDDEIKKAYRKLTKSLHPDLNPNDKQAEERFKTVSAAYDILGKKDRRQQYDNGQIDESGAEKAPQFQQGHGGMNDAFASMFRQQQMRPTKGQDVSQRLWVSFRDAALGVKEQVLMPDGSYLNVGVPAGIEDGQTVRLRGEGHAGMYGGPAGDAMIQVSVRPDPVFKRNGLNVDVTLPVTIYEAALGGKVEVPTLKGAVGLKIPAGSNTGKTFRLKGRGIAGKSGSGDQMITLAVQMPDQIDEPLADFLTSWAENNAYDPRQNIKGSVDV